ncbi:MAG TPA: hypothetical protein VLV86_22690 [Vicinamibacterales bacterium]|nr:hypothetical protein [Vicinamibacterales bacterium]
METTGTFALATIEDLLPAIQDKSLGDASLNLKLASGQIESDAHLTGSLPVDFTFHVGGDFSVQLLNGKNGSDDMGVVAAADADTDTPAGHFAPLFQFDKVNGWLKYVASADVKADMTDTVSIVTFVGSAGARIAMADYHRHSLADGLRSVIPTDLLALRSAMVLSHVQNLRDGDALAFQTEGQLSTSLDIAWSDVFTSEISGLTSLLRAASPVAINTTIGATCSVTVSVDDGFIVAFARQGGRLRVAVRKSGVKQIDATAGATIDVAISDPETVETVLDDVVAGLLGTAADRVRALVSSLAIGAPSQDQTSLATEIVERLKLSGPDQIDKAIADLKSKAADQIKNLVESKVEAAFTYEYHRVSSDVSLFEADIVGTLSQPLHQQIVSGDLHAAFDRPATEIAVTKFLNERTTTVSRAWGFTLGLNKWTLFGKDRRDSTLVERVDRLAKTISRSYIGSGGYERTKLSWTVDFAADMPHASTTPMVGDYQFGLHLAVVRDQQTFNAQDLETALDFAVLWNICPETAIAFVRSQLSPAIDKQGEWSFHLRVNDEALRPMVRVLGSMIPRDFAGAAAAALDPSLVPSVALRRKTWTPLWQLVLAGPDACHPDTARVSAQSVLNDPVLASRERDAADQKTIGFDTVAGTVRADDTWFPDCASFSRGCRLLADAIAVPTIDRGQIADVYRKMLAFWVQSHYVRTLGVALVDCARAVGQFKGVQRTLNFTSGGATTVISSNQF